MDRFTKLLENGSIVVDCNICDQNQRTCHPLYCRHRLIQRLAEYEGTGLEPDEIDMLQSNKLLDDQERRLLFAYESIGPIDHLRELVQAEADKRLVVLPCKVGDAVYRVIRSKDGGGHIAPATVSALHLGDTKRNRRYKKDNEYIVLSVDGLFFAHVDIKKIGKTVFLTREEAEAALKGCDRE